MKIRSVGAKLLYADGHTHTHARARARGRTDGQTDRYDEASSRFSQFCERA